MARVKCKADFSKLEKFVKNKTSKRNVLPILDKYGERGVKLLRDATPIKTGKTASSWYYSISENKDYYIVSFNNSNVSNGVNIAVILQYGHGTRNGGYVQGIDYMNPALKTAFEELKNELIKEVKR